MCIRDRSQKLGGMFSPISLYPTQLFEAGATLLIFGFLMWLRKRRKFEGQIILSYAILYAMARFVIEFWRGDERGSLLGLSPSPVSYTHLRAHETPEHL